MINGPVTACISLDIAGPEALSRQNLLVTGHEVSDPRQTAAFRGKIVEGPAGHPE